MSAQELTAGYVLDSVIAEKWMGWRVVHVQEVDHSQRKRVDVHPLVPEGYRDPKAPAKNNRRSLTWSPSTNMAHAWEVVGARQVALWKTSDGLWHACFEEAFSADDFWVEIDSNHTIGHGDTAPLAICRAALAALEKT